MLAKNVIAITLLDLELHNDGKCRLIYLYCCYKDKVALEQQANFNFIVSLGIETK